MEKGDKDLARQDTMPAASNEKSSAAKTQEYQALVRQVADRVWELWRRELRQSQERKGRRS